MTGGLREKQEKAVLQALKRVEGQWLMLWLKPRPTKPLEVLGMIAAQIGGC